MSARGKLLAKMVKDPTKPFETEAALCAAFVSVLPEGWTPYAETAGWDLLLVRVDGFQVGVQAKLRLNAQVFAQAVEGRHDVDHAGPDCRAILVPWTDCQLGLGVFSPFVGITIVRMPRVGLELKRRGHWQAFEPMLPEQGAGKSWMAEQHWYELAPVRRCALPEYVPDVAAGAPAPVQLTDWKINALKIAVLLEERGHVTRADFRHIGIDHRRWLGGDWLTVEAGRFVRGPNYPGFEKQHPKVFEQIKADRAKWAPKQEGLPL